MLRKIVTIIDQSNVLSTLDIFLGFCLAADVVTNAQLSVVPFRVSANVIVKSDCDSLGEFRVSRSRQLFEAGFRQNFAQVVTDRVAVSLSAGTLQSYFCQNEGKLKKL